MFFDHIPHGKTIISWHATHGRFPACYARRIDWDVCYAALKRLPLGRQRWVAKHTPGFCSVGTKRVKWQEQPTADCPCCGQSENARHVWLCPDPAVYFVWALIMSSFSNWLTSIHTATEITYWIIQSLTEWRSQDPFSIADTELPGLLQAIDAQDHMGWLAFFEGCIAVKWAGVQQAHFLWLGRRNTGKRWATSLVVKLWEIAWDLWMTTQHETHLLLHCQTLTFSKQKWDVFQAIHGKDDEQGVKVLFLFTKDFVCGLEQRNGTTFSITKNRRLVFYDDIFSGVL
jgi:hypothetical protein